MPVDVPDRTWPTKKITQAPRWLSTDLRDGNQALIDPMTPARKLTMFELLVTMGYKEIEVGFPSASQTDFDFVRKLIEEDRIPDDVQISVLTQAREDLIERTVDSLVGAPRATVHLYNATAPLFQRVVFNVTPDECRNIAVRGTEMVMKYAEERLGDLVGSEDFGYQYSPEIFTQSDTDFALSVCEAVSDVWQPEAGREIILNLPATVEMSTPNTYADQIEYFGRGLTRREHSAISLHPHNDRGTAVAATELGADGRRRPGRGLPVRPRRAHRQRRPGHPRHEPVQPGHRPADRLRRHRRGPPHGRVLHQPAGPPAPPLRRRPRLHRVLRVPPGRHQEGPRGPRASGRASAASPVGEMPWEAPYLPIDPKDVGRTYEAVIRVNSQSGKGGVAYILKSEHKLDLPRRAQIEFSRVIQQRTDTEGGEVTPEEIWSVFRGRVPRPRGPAAARLGAHLVSAAGEKDQLTVNVFVDGERADPDRRGQRPDRRVRRRHQRARRPSRRRATRRTPTGATSASSTTTSTRSPRAATPSRRPMSSAPWGTRSCGASALDANIVTASLRAVVSAVNRA